MAESISGPVLFFRYAWPCAEDRLRLLKISDADFVEIDRLRRTNGVPPIELLERCFPDAVRGLRDHARKGSCGLRSEWSFETVAEYWRAHHGHSGACAVWRGLVLSVEGLIVGIDVGGRKENALNMCRIPVSPGDVVFVHRHMIAEKLEVTLSS